MELVYKDYFIWGNEIPFMILCSSILAMIFICFILGWVELRKK